MSDDFFKKELKNIVSFLKEQFGVLIEWVKEHKKVVIIGTFILFSLKYLFSEENNEDE